MITKLSEGKSAATLELVDKGQIKKKIDVSKLRPLPPSLAEPARFAIKTKLAGVKPVAKVWEEHQDMVDELLGIGESAIKFSVEVLTVDEKGVPEVFMVDDDRTDTSTLFVDLEFMIKASSVEPLTPKGKVAAIEDPDPVKADPPSAGPHLTSKKLEFRPGSLPSGQQTLLVLEAVSPVEIYLCEAAALEATLGQFEAKATECEVAASLVMGEAVLVCDDNMWYRATVQEPQQCKVIVRLVDLGHNLEVSIDKIRIADEVVVATPVAAVPCCLHSWTGMERGQVKQTYGHLMSELVEEYAEVLVEVLEPLPSEKSVNEKEIVYRVKIPELEDKLKKSEASSPAKQTKIDMLKEKLKKK